MKTELLREIIAPVCKTPEKTAKLLAEHYGSFLAIAEADIYSLTALLGGDSSLALYVRLAVDIASRRGTDRFKFGKKHTEEEIKEYLISLFFGVSVETVYMISFDGQGRITACDKVGEGTVNYSSILPRKIIETAKRRGAKSVAIAHNHPGGYAHPSEDDLSASRTIFGILSTSGIKFFGSYIVAAAECVKILAD